jgi:hypothetical protein
MLAAIRAFATVGVQQVSTAVGERHRVLAPSELHGLRQAFIAEVAEVWCARVQGLFARVAEVTFRDHAEHADDRECATVVAIQLVLVVTVEHELAFPSTRQLEVLDKRISRIILARADRRRGRECPPHHRASHLVLRRHRIVDRRPAAFPHRERRHHYRADQNPSGPIIGSGGSIAIHDRIETDRFGSVAVESLAIAWFSVELCSTPSTLSAFAPNRAALGVDGVCAQLTECICAMTADRFRQCSRIRREESPTLR